MITISESLANEIGLDGATVYSYVSVILSTDFYKDRFKGCRVKGKKCTAFISISKLKELPLRKPGLNTTRCYQLVNVIQHLE